MKIRLLVALAGFAIACAVPALAQDGSNVDPQVRKVIQAALTQFEEALNKHDATAMAMLFTLDAVLVLDWGEGGTFSGQQAIAKNYAIDFASSPPKFAEKLIHMYPIGDAISAISEWSQGLWKGYHTRIYVRDADTWKIRMDYAIHLEASGLRVTSFSGRLAPIIFYTGGHKG